MTRSRIALVMVGLAFVPDPGTWPLPLRIALVAVSVLAAVAVAAALGTGLWALHHRDPLDRDAS